MPWLPGIIERHHDIQNPSSPDKIRSMAEAMLLSPADRVLDLGGGRGGPAIIFARDFGCHVTTIDWFPEFTSAAKARGIDAGVQDRLEIITGDAAKIDLPARSFNAVVCLGATFVFGGLTESIEFMKRFVVPGGHIAVGEPYDRGLPLPEGVERDEHWPTLSLASLLATFDDQALRVVGVAPSSPDDWDRYESLHMLGLQTWLDTDASADDRATFEAGHRAGLFNYVRQREQGWAIVAARVPDEATISE